MRWLKKDMWKVAIVLAGLLILLGLMVVAPIMSASASSRTLGFTLGMSLRATPTDNATMIALNKESHDWRTG
jgi:uncharacterized membrane protein HdeD (DUF308 family)